MGPLVSFVALKFVYITLAIDSYSVVCHINHCFSYTFLTCHTYNNIIFICNIFLPSGL